MKDLEVSVLLCSYNASLFIRDAIDSVLYQSYADFELVVVDDGSTDNTLEIINEYNDPRIRLIPSNHDYIASLNKGLKECKGKYIVRMDADDIMEPDRISIQVRIMETHSEIAVCASWAKTFDIRENIIGNSVQGVIKDIDVRFLLGNFLIHPTTIIRHAFLEKYNIRYKKYLYAEDFKLWTDIALKGGGFYVVSLPLLRYRTNSMQLTKKHWEEQNASRIRIQQEIIERKIKEIHPKYKQLVNKLYRLLLTIHRDSLLSSDSILSVIYYILINLKRKGH